MMTTLSGMKKNGEAFGGAGDVPAIGVVVRAHYGVFHPFYHGLPDSYTLELVNDAPNGLVINVSLAMKFVGCLALYLLE